MVDGTALGSCLGDEFSIHWLEDADVANFHKETVKQQVTNVTAETHKSHVQQYGNSSIIPSEVIDDFEGNASSYHRASSTQSKDDYSTRRSSAVNTRDVDIHLAYYNMIRAKTQQEEVFAQAELEQLMTKRAVQDARFSRIALILEPNQQKAEDLLLGPVDRFSLRDVDCHKAALKAVVKSCGPLDDYTMRYSRLFANLCSSHISSQSIEFALKQECARPQLVPEHRWSEAAALVSNSTFDFKEDVFHIFASSNPSFHKTDVYNLTGHLTDEGGVVTANCQNNTKNHTCSHSIKFTEAYRPYPGATMQFFRNISATVGGKGFSGHTVFLNISGNVSCLDIFYHDSNDAPAATLFQGPNPPPGPAPPPPPPPPPSYCTSEFDKKACGSKGSCTWCKSKDNVHKLCFTKGHTPKKGWSCEKADVDKDGILMV